MKALKEAPYLNPEDAIDKKVLSFMLVAAILYLLLWSAMNFHKPNMVSFAIFLASVFTLLFYLLKKKMNINLISSIFHFCAFIGFAFFYALTGGMAGGIPGFLCIYIAFIIMVSRGIWLWSSLSIMFILVLIFIYLPATLGMSDAYEPENINAFELAVRYILMAIILGAIAFYYNKKYYYYRGKVSSKSNELKLSNKNLRKKNLILEERKAQTLAINDNLENTIKQRTENLEIKNQELAKYAFINSHLLKGPLCRIMGLIMLLETEKSATDTEVLHEAKRLTSLLNDQLKEMNVKLWVE